MKQLDYLLQRYLIANIVLWLVCSLFWWWWMRATNFLNYWIISLITGVFFIILSLLIFRIHRKATYQLRQYFYRIYQKLEDFDVAAPTKIQFAASPIQEFDELSQNLNDLIEQLHDNYHANKQFTQNAAHELQTPVMIIKANAELLLQSPKMKQGEIEAIANVLMATNRLSRLNSTLILLSKIEHGRYIDTEKLQVTHVVKIILKNFKDLIQMQGLKISKYYQYPLTVEMSATLLEILMTNLIQNAIRHNIPKGYIHILITQKSVIIKNTGHPLTVPPEQLFQRFHRSSHLEESLGLGLSIVKRICEQYNFKVNYTYTPSQIHCLTVLFE